MTKAMMTTCSMSVSNSEDPTIRRIMALHPPHRGTASRQTVSRVDSCICLELQSEGSLQTGNRHINRASKNEQRFSEVMIAQPLREPAYNALPYRCEPRIQNVADGNSRSDRRIQGDSDIHGSTTVYIIHESQYRKWVKSRRPRRCRYSSSNTGHEYRRTVPRRVFACSHISPICSENQGDNPPICGAE